MWARAWALVACHQEERPSVVVWRSLGAVCRRRSASRGVVTKVHISWPDSPKSLLETAVTYSLPASRARSLMSSMTFSVERGKGQGQPSVWPALELDRIRERTSALQTTSTRDIFSYQMDTVYPFLVGDILEVELRIKNGRSTVPGGAGWGVDVDMARVEAFLEA